MKAEDKQKYVEELRKIYSSLSIQNLLSDPDAIKQIQKINRVIAILKNFDSGVGNKLENKRNEFQKWCRAGKRPRHSEILAKQILQFIDQKIEEMDIYVIEDEKKALRPLKLLREQIEKIESLKAVDLWGPEYQIWKNTTSKLIKSLFGDEYLKLFENQEAGVFYENEEVNRQLYLEELEKCKKFLQAAIKEKNRLGDNSSFPKTHVVTKQSSLDVKDLFKKQLKKLHEESGIIIGQAIHVDNDLKLHLRKKGITNKDFSNILRYLMGKGYLKGYSSQEDVLDDHIGNTLEL